MDKENNKDIENNIDDVLKHLRSIYENQDEPADDVEVFENEKTENISPEEISERLLKQFMGKGGKESATRQKSEYAIDESLMSEFIDEAQNAESSKEKEEIEEIEEIDEELIEQEEFSNSLDESEEPGELEVIEETEEGEKQEISTEACEETLEDEKYDSEIVEIVIPIIDMLTSNEASKSEVDFEEEDEEESSEEEENEDFYDEETTDSAFVCFADDEVNDEEIFLDEEEDSGDEISKADESANEEEDSSLEDSDEKEESDDLPWYTEDELSTNNNPLDEEEKEEEAIIILPLDEKEIDIDEDAPDAFEKVLDGELEAEEEAESFAIEEALKEVEESEEIEKNEEAVSFEDEISENETAEESMNEETEEVLLQEEKPVYSLFGDKKQEETEKSISEDDAVSFYRTIIAARTEREMQYGYPITEPSNVSEIYEGDFKSSDVEAVESVVSEVSLETLEEEINEEDALLKNDEVLENSSGDFFDMTEHAEQTEVHENRDEIHTYIEFEEENEEEEEKQEKESSKFVKILKHICMFALPIAILWLELLPIFGIVPDGLLDYESYRAAYVLIDAQLLIFMAALNYEKLLDGIKKILTPLANFYSVLSTTVIATLLGSILSCFCTTDDVPRSFNFISALYLLASYLLEHYERRRKKEGMQILEKGAGVFTLKRSQGKNSTAEKMYAGGVDPDKSIFEVAEIESDSFYPAFSREKVEKNKKFSNNIIIGAIIPTAIFGIIMSVLAIVFERDLYAVFNTFAFAVAVTAPVSAIVAYYLPLLISHKRLSGRGCVVAGYEAASDIAECDALIFGDTHLYKECNAREAGIKLFCDEKKTREMFVCLACAYAKIGGPMKNTFSSVLSNEVHKVSMIRITRNGFESVVDNKNTLIVGSTEYLSRYGIFVEGDHNNQEPGVIYVALNSVLCAKINVFYRTQPLFEALLEILEDYAVRPVIETYDPIITGKYVAKSREAGANPISVVHKNINDYKSQSKNKQPLGRFGAFATASRLKLVELMSFCKSLMRIRFVNNCILIGSYALSCLLCTLFVINGAVESANIVWVLLYQLALMGAYTFATLKLLPLSFDGMQEKKRREEERKQEKEN